MFEQTIERWKRDHARAYEVWVVDPKPEKGPDGSMIYRVVTKNCLGEDMPSAGAYKRIRTTVPAGKPYFDARSLESIAGGCCPPQLMKDYIEREGELVERDPVEEAMKLHKRGYFGGGS